MPVMMPLRSARKMLFVATLQGLRWAEQKAVVVLTKGDWAEFAVRLGFPTWSNNIHPCMLCHASQDKWFSLIGYSALGMPSPSKRLAEHDSACKVCEIWLTLDPTQLAEVRSSRGRALIADIPLLGLRKGDRLEPCPRMRVSNETWVRHRNPDRKSVV